MFTVNLEKELLLQKQETLAKEEQEIKKAETLLASVNKILGDSVADDLDIVRRVGFNLNQIRVAQGIIESRNNKSKFDKQRIFTVDEIRALCIKYRLRFLQTKYYCGHLSPTLPQKIKEFENTLGEKLYPHGCYIVAPAGSFVLTPKPKDPMLFYELSANEYYLIEKWGGDISWMRQIFAFPLRSTKHLVLSTLLPLLSALFVLAAMFTDGGIGFISVILGIPLWLAGGLIYDLTSIGDKFAPSNECWNSEHF